MENCWTQRLHDLSSLLTKMKPKFNGFCLFDIFQNELQQCGSRFVYNAARNYPKVTGKKQNIKSYLCIQCLCIQGSFLDV